jgi:hypothetical protein
MGKITIYNVKNEEHTGPGVFYCGRGSALGNPYTHIKDRETKAKYVVRSRDEAIDRYEQYFNVMYGHNRDFTEAFDRIYDYYASGRDVYLGCYCFPQRCHCDIIANNLRKTLIREKIKERSSKKAL